MIMLPYEKKVSDVLIKFMATRGIELLPSWLWKRIMLLLPSYLSITFRIVRVVVGLSFLTPLLLWPPAWSGLAAAFRRARDRNRRD